MRISRLFLAVLAVLATTACSDITGPSQETTVMPTMGSGSGG